MEPRYATGKFLLRRKRGEAALYLCSLPNHAQVIAYAVHSHGEIENPVHWVLDRGGTWKNSHYERLPGRLALFVGGQGTERCPSPNFSISTGAMNT
jgi:hypothetical protein